MNHHSKRLIKELESLGFQRDYDAKTVGLAYRHSNQPDQILKVFDAMTDNTITAVSRKANKIADTGWSGPRQPQTIKERAQVTRSKKTSQQQRDDRERQARADKAEREHDQRERITAVARHDREIEALMQPGSGR